MFVLLGSEQSEHETEAHRQHLQAGRTTDGHPDSSVLTHSPVSHMPLSQPADRPVYSPYPVNVPVESNDDSSDSDNTTHNRLSTTVSSGKQKPFRSALFTTSTAATTTTTTSTITTTTITTTTTATVTATTATCQGTVQASASTNTSISIDNDKIAQINEEKQIVDVAKVEEKQANTAEDEQVYEDLLIACSEMTSSTPAPHNPEENYMTMTSKQSVLVPWSSPCKEQTNESNGIENDYMEMTRGLTALVLDCDQNDDVTNDDHFGLHIDVQPYETVSFGENRIEPVYMELSQPSTSGKSVLNKTDDKSDLPDILIASKDTFSKNTKSDGSDADDEASKELDSLEAPCHPRFSLSDTFRPASYYLGASRVRTEFHDSSDSELVSPPPIPTSPSLMDDLDNSFYRQDRNTDDLLNVTVRDEDTSIHSVSSDLRKYHRSSYNNVTSAEQNISSSGTENERMLKRRPLSEDFYNEIELDYDDSIDNINVDRILRDLEVSDIRKQYRSPHNNDVHSEQNFSSATDNERLLKRRPLSEDFYDEVELDIHESTTDTINLNSSLRDLDDSNNGTVESNISLSATVPSFSHVNSSFIEEYINQTPPQHEYENLCIPSTSAYGTCAANNTSLTSEDQQNDQFTNSANETHFFLYHPLNAPPDISFNDCYVMLDDMTSNEPMSEEPTSEEPNIQQLSSRRTSPSSRTDNSVTNGHDLPIKVSPVSISAPYYYSDLSSTTMSTSTICNTPIYFVTLNNQRSFANVGKKDITRIVNPIHCNSELSNSSQSTSGQRQDLDNTVTEARSVSADFLNIADKSGQIDKKNIYESDTLKRAKAMDSVSSLQSNPETVNLYPAYPSEKQFSSNDCNDPNAMRRTHSLEGLLANVLNECTTVAPVSRGTQHENSVVVSDGNEGSEVWEEDSVWRERLRIASLRHTRSLDDLDNLGSEHNGSINIQQQQQLYNSQSADDDDFDMTEDPCVFDEHDLYKEIALGDDVNTTSELEFSDSGQEQESMDSHIDKIVRYMSDRETLRHWDLLSSAPSVSNKISWVKTVGLTVDKEQGSSKDKVHEQTETDAQDTGTCCLFA